MVGLTAALAGCVPPSPLARMTPRGEWAIAYQNADQAVIGGRYEEADSILVRFIAEHQGSREGADAQFWRAVYALDPANRTGSTSAAIAELDRYLEGPPTLPHWREAATLRRVAAQLETATRLAAAAAAAPPSPTPSPSPTSVTRIVTTEDHSKDDEIQRLRTELARANEELERIKKRLAKP